MLAFPAALPDDAVFSRPSLTAEVAMSIHAVCPTCAAKINAPDKAAGKRVKCPKCGEPLVVPSATGPTPAWMDDERPATTPRRPRVPTLAEVDLEDLAANILSDGGEDDAASHEPSEEEQGVTFSCPSCEEAYRVSEELVGKKIRCRKCGESSRIAADAASLPASAVAKQPRATAPAASLSLKVPELKDLPKPGFPWLPVVLVAAGVAVLVGAAGLFIGIGFGLTSHPSPAPASPAATTQPSPQPPKENPKVRIFREKVAQFLDEARAGAKLLTLFPSVDQASAKADQIEDLYAHLPEVPPEIDPTGEVAKKLKEIDGLFFLGRGYAKLALEYASFNNTDGIKKSYGSCIRPRPI